MQNRRHGGRDTKKKSRHKIFKKLNIEVATSRRVRDVNTESEDVATSLSGRDISYKESRSRHHSVVATSVTKKEGRDSIYQLRHQLQRMEVATSFNGRDISCNERRSRHHSVVATSVIKKGGRDVIQWS